MTVAVPNLIGATLASATATLLGAGLVVGTLTGNSGGIINGQSPAATTIVAVGSAVNLTFTPYCRVQAAQPGYYGGDYKDVGDVFDVLLQAEFQSSAVSLVPVGNPVYPLYGWMTQVANSTALYSWAAYGNSSPKSGVYLPNSVGAVNLSIPRYVA